ncbi:MAG: hypothetical protein GY820_28060 [Gammaproteobacteria bacterium]|nr:hypothetical protein [Gammaproteobacteria bacterium]
MIRNENNNEKCMAMATQHNIKIGKKTYEISQVHFESNYLAKIMVV